MTSAFTMGLIVSGEITFAFKCGKLVANRMNGGEPSSGK